MVKNYWKRLSYYDKVLAMFFMINIFLDIINKKVLNSVIPNEIIGYLFWISLGLYLGFQICKYEFKRVLKNMNEIELKEGNQKKRMSQSCSPN